MTTYLSRFTFITAFAHLALELCTSFLPVIYPALIVTMGLTYSQIGLIAMVALMSGTLTQPFFGYLSDHWGPRQIIIFSLAWVGVLMGLVGVAPNYGSLLMIVGLAMLGSAAFHPAGAVLASTTAGNRRGAAISVFSVGGTLGAAFSPLLIAAAIGWLGPSGTAIIIPFALLVSIVLYQQLTQEHALLDNHPVKTNPQAKTPAKSAPVIVGLTLITFVVMTRSWFQVSLMTYLPQWIQSQGYSLAFGGQILAIFMVSISVGSMVGGPLSDRVGRWQVVALSMTFLGVVQWFFLHSPLAGQMIFAALMGIMIGVSLPVAIVMAQETWPAGVGMASALVLGLGWAPGGLGAWFTGLAADRFSLPIGLQFLIIPPLLGVIATVAYALLRRKTYIAKN
jgi:FSR family fosmidomycin resistance protein-like MFS transporter